MTGLATVLVGCLLGVAVTAYAIHQWGQIERFDDLELDLVVRGEPANYLIIGDDPADGSRADSIVLFRIIPQDEQVAVLTIPRDLLLPLARDGEFDPDATPQQINHAYAGEDGRDDLIQTLRENFGIQIHHYIEINTEGFVRLIDQVGGVELYIDRAIHDPKTGLLIEDLGCVTLDGETALRFARSRNLHTMGESGWELADVTADLGRGTRQQGFIRQAVSKALKEAPTNPNKLRGTVEILADTVALDDGFSISDTLELIQQFRDMNAHDREALQTLSLPLEEVGNRVVLKDIDAEPILNVFRGLPLNDFSPSAVSLTVLNGTGGENEATNVAGALQRVEMGGFKITEVGDTEERPERTTVYHAPGERNLGLRVARHIKGGAAVLERDDVGSGEAELVTGPGLDTVYETAMPFEDLPDTGPTPGVDAPESEQGADAGAAGEGDGMAEQPEGATGGEEPASELDTTTTTVEYGTAIGAGGAC